MDVMDRSLDNTVSTVSRLQRNDSFRKVLPSKPSATVDSRLSMSMKMIDRPALADSKNRGNKMFIPYMLEYAVLAEYIMLQKQELTGIYVIPSDQDPKLWFGVIFIQQGLYQGGIFRFYLQLPENFPDGTCPKVIFESYVFHPAVNIETGELNVSEEFKEWRRTMNHIWHVLHYIRRIFYTVESRNPANVVAHEMYIKDNAKFKEMIQECVEESQKNIYKAPNTEDLNYICFRPSSDSSESAIETPVSDSTKGESLKTF